MHQYLWWRRLLVNTRCRLCVWTSTQCQCTNVNPELLGLIAKPKLQILLFTHQWPPDKNFHPAFNQTLLLTPLFQGLARVRNTREKVKKNRFWGTAFHSKARPEETEAFPQGQGHFLKQHTLMTRGRSTHTPQSEASSWQPITPATPPTCTPPSSSCSAFSLSLLHHPMQLAHLLCLSFITQLPSIEYKLLRARISAGFS